MTAEPAGNFCSYCGLWVHDTGDWFCEDCGLPTCERCGIVDEQTDMFICLDCFVKD